MLGGATKARNSTQRRCEPGITRPGEGVNAVSEKSITEQPASVSGRTGVTAPERQSLWGGERQSTKGRVRFENYGHRRKKCPREGWDGKRTKNYSQRIAG